MIRFSLIGLLAGAAMALGYLDFHKNVVSLVREAPVTWGIPGKLVQRVRRFRLKRETVQESYEEAMFALALRLRAGESLIQAIRDAGEEGEGGMFAVLRRAYRLYESGTPVVEAMRRAAEGNQAAQYTAEIIQMALNTGADMVSLLCRAADMMRNSRMFSEEMSSRLVEAKITAAILTVMPWLVTLATFKLVPDTARAFFGSPYGRLLATIALSMWASGILLVRASVNAVARSIIPQRLQGRRA